MGRNIFVIRKRRKGRSMQKLRSVHKKVIDVLEQSAKIKEQEDEGVMHMGESLARKSTATSRNTSMLESHFSESERKRGQTLFLLPLCSHCHLTLPHSPSANRRKSRRSRWLDRLPRQIQKRLLLSVLPLQSRDSLNVRKGVC